MGSLYRVEPLIRLGGRPLGVVPAVHLTTATVTAWLGWVGRAWSLARVVQCGAAGAAAHRSAVVAGCGTSAGWLVGAGTPSGFGVEVRPRRAGVIVLALSP